MDDQYAALMQMLTSSEQQDPMATIKGLMGLRNEQVTNQISTNLSGLITTINNALNSGGGGGGGGGGILGDVIGIGGLIGSFF